MEETGLMKLFTKTKEIFSKTGVLHFRRFAIIAFESWGIYIHVFTQHDKEKHEHDHPWDFSSLVLYGGYVEQHNGEFKTRKVGSFQRFTGEHTHRIHRLLKDKCVTLVFMGKRKRFWGYKTENGWIGHVTYRNMKREGEL